MPVGEMAITSLPRGKFLTAVSCSCLAVNNFAIFAKNIQKRLSVCLAKICIVISVVPWRCPLGDFDWRVCLLTQWQWPVCQHTGLTKNACHLCSWFFSCLSPRLLTALEFVITAFPLSQCSTCLKTAKLHRLVHCLLLITEMTFIMKVKSDHRSKFSNCLRTNVAKAWAKLEMVIKNFPSYFVCSYIIKPWCETTCCGICLVSDANLHWAPGGGKFRPKNAIFFPVFFLKIGILRSKYFKEHTTI